MSYSIGIDLGCTYVKGLAVSLRGKVLAEAAVPTAGARGRWREQVRAVYERLCEGVGVGPSAVGMAAPGLPASDAASIAHMPGRLPGLEGLVWRKFLRLPHPVPVLNDAQAALLGEVWIGGARGARNAVLLTLGTGVGGGALVDGVLLRGHLGRAGHLGHVSLNPDGPADVTGTPGSLEWAIGDYTVAERSGGRFDSTAKLVAAVRRGDRPAREVWQRSVRALGAAVAGFINVLDPEVVVIGGGIAQAGPLLFRPLRACLDRFEWRPGGQRARIVPAKLGDRAGAFGAAWNAIRLVLERTP
jgi:glucokinase